jgi:colicin import membrane protein
MKDFFRRHSVSAGYSLLLHTGILAMFFLSFPDTAMERPATPVPETVRAVMLDESAIEEEVRKLREIETKKQQQQQARQKKLETARKEEARRLKKLKEQAAKENRKLQELKKNRKKVEQQRIKEQKRLKKLEKKRKAEEKKRKQEEKRKAEEKARRLAEQKAVEEKRIAEEQRRKQESEAKASTERRDRKATADANAKIEAKLNRLWRRPLGTAAGLSCVILVKTVPGGEVVNARVTRSSGNAPFDRSAERAVMKASPLPVPDDPRLYRIFRNFEFRFRPDS